MNLFVIFGYGIQGKKRAQILSELKIKFIIVDPIYKKSDYKYIKNIPLNVLKKVTHCIISTPYGERGKIIQNLKKFKIKILIEKPGISSLAERNYYKKNIQITKNIYIAYNHLFEKSINELKKNLSKKKIGNIYLIQMIYGNGTAKNVKKSNWKDKNKGVIFDLMPHLLDIFYFLFNYFPKTTSLKSIKKKFENNSYDYAELLFETNKLHISFKTSYIYWKNYFEIFIIGSKGYFKLQGLPKWGSSTLQIAKRKFPSGKPTLKIKKYKNIDLTWKKEIIKFSRNNFDYFKLNKEVKQFNILNKC